MNDFAQNEMDSNDGCLAHDLLESLPLCRGQRFLRQDNEANEVEFITFSVTGALLSVAFCSTYRGPLSRTAHARCLGSQVLQRAPIDNDERKYGEALLPIVQQRHTFLVTLLLLNTLAYETV